MAFNNHGFGGGEEEEARREGRWVTEVFGSKHSPKERGLGEVEEVGLAAADQVTEIPYSVLPTRTSVVLTNLR